MNNVSIVGNITRDIELNNTQSGIATSRFSIAVNRRPDANGERKADFFNCVAWRKTAEFLAKYCKKGSRVAISGHLVSGSYDKDGHTVYTVEIVVDNVDLMSSSQAKSGSEKNNETPDLEPLSDDEDVPF